MDGYVNACSCYCCSNKTSCYTQVVNFSTKLDVEEAINWFANNKTTSMKGILSIETHNYEIDKVIDLTYATHSIDKSIDYISGNEIFTSGTWIDSTGIYSYTSIDKTSLNKESLKNEKVKYKVNSKNLTEFPKALLKWRSRSPQTCQLIWPLCGP